MQVIFGQAFEPVDEFPCNLDSKIRVCKIRQDCPDGLDHMPRGHLAEVFGEFHPLLVQPLVPGLALFLYVLAQLVFQLVAQFRGL